MRSISVREGTQYCSTSKLLEKESCPQQSFSREKYVALNSQAFRKIPRSCSRAVGAVHGVLALAQRDRRPGQHSKCRFGFVCVTLSHRQVRIADVAGFIVFIPRLVLTVDGARLQFVSDWFLNLGFVRLKVDSNAKPTFERTSTRFHSNHLFHFGACDLQFKLWHLYLGYYYFVLFAIR